jgi:hypothetical protein
MWSLDADAWTPVAVGLGALPHASGLHRGHCTCAVRVSVCAGLCIQLCMYSEMHIATPQVVDVMASYSGGSRHLPRKEIRLGGPRRAFENQAAFAPVPRFNEERGTVTGIVLCRRHYLRFFGTFCVDQFSQCYSPAGPIN